MLKPDRSELDYFQLVKRARRLEPGDGRKLRLALLADVSTQHLVPLLRVLFAGNGLNVEIYEGAYDAVELEALDPGSGLYRAAPEVVVILQSTWKLAAAYHDYPDDRSGFVKARATRSETVWRTILERTGARAYTRDQARRYRDEALAELDAAGVLEPAAREHLEGIIVSAISA